MRKELERHPKERFLFCHPEEANGDVRIFARQCDYNPYYRTKRPRILTSAVPASSE